MCLTVKHHWFYKYNKLLTRVGHNNGKIKWVWECLHVVQWCSMRRMSYFTFIKLVKNVKYLLCKYIELFYREMLENIRWKLPLCLFQFQATCKRDHMLARLRTYCAHVQKKKEEKMEHFEENTNWLHRVETEMRLLDQGGCIPKVKGLSLQGQISCVVSNMWLKGRFFFFPSPLWFW